MTIINKPTIYNTPTIYNLGGGGGGGGDLPEGYTEVLAIDNPNGASTTPGLLVFSCIANTHDFIECYFQFTRTDTSWSKPVHISHSSNYGTPKMCPEIIDDPSLYGLKDYSSDLQGPIFATIEYPGWYQRKKSIWIKYHNTEIINSVTGTHGAVSPTAQNIDSVILWPNNNEFHGAIKNIKIEGKLDLIPCLNENNIAGFYDKVNGVFKGNANLVAIE